MIGCVTDSSVWIVSGVSLQKILTFTVFLTFLLLKYTKPYALLQFTVWHFTLYTRMHAQVYANFAVIKLPIFPLT